MIILTQFVYNKGIRNILQTNEMKLSLIVKGLYTCNREYFLVWQRTLVT